MIVRDRILDVQEISVDYDEMNPPWIFREGLGKMKEFLNNIILKE